MPECIPEGKTHINDAQVRGYVGYIAPELCSGVLNEKCDVYGFGALLLELLSGRLISKTKDIDFGSSSEPMLWNKIIKDNSSIIELVDPIIVGDGLCSETQHQLIVFAELAIKCLSVTPENRPTMIDVAKRLRQFIHVLDCKFILYTFICNFLNETPIPILVFESLFKYGTLQDHIDRHHELHLESLSWRQRLKITMEIANTFAYLHVGFPRPIVYAYISALQFLLDEHYVPKLVDFSYAECIPEGQTQIKGAQVRGFIGFMAPEQFNGVLNESCDVYGFGALLFEVLTGQWIHNLVRSNEMKDEDFKSSSEIKDNEDRELSYKTKEKYWLCNFVKKINEDNRLIEALDPIIVGDGLCPEIEQQLKVCMKLAVKCLSYSGEDRPTMIDVAKQLRQLYLSTS
ncbi:hypothetical protein LWI28_009651 [Acer negundo]|uniref:Protein kinase domain-containing protein n=1 Tax=Acer negundo TaxID=4023 RepID=A0AAD5J544_ACENE|nr:hypothetical protein LWI28_009651 [Acer negundo]